MVIVNELNRILAEMVADSGCALRYSTYETPSMANVVLDGAEMPAAVLYCATDYRVSCSSGIVREHASVGVYFCVRQPNVDFHGAENEDLLDTLKPIAMRFVGKVADSDVIAIDSEDIDVQSIYDKYDTNTTGLFLKFELAEMSGQCLAQY